MTIRDKIVIGLCTFNRNEQLKEALDSLSNIILPENAECILLLIDNNPHGDAKYIFDAYHDDFPFKSYYVHEAQTGLCHARNCLLKHALLHEATVVAMVDDDEIVTQEWLSELHKAYKENNCDGVSGTVYRLLQQDSSKFIKTIWKNCKEERNKQIKFLGTGNCMFSSKIIHPDHMGLQFDNSFGFSGREDVVFSFDAQLKGANFFSAPDAIVIEKFPKKRCTFYYLLRRWMENGMSDVAIAKRFKFPREIRTLKEIISIILRPIACVFCAPFDKVKSAKHILYTAASLGWLLGMLNFKATFYDPDKISFQ